MKGVFPVLSFFVLCTVGCNNKVSSVVRSEVIYDSIVIHNEYPYLGRYYQYSATMQNGNIILVGYNRHIPSFDFLDLTTGENLFYLPLTNEGENIGTPSELYVTSGSIVTRQLNSQVVRMDFNGRVINKVDGYEITDPDNGNIYTITPKGPKILKYLPSINSQGTLTVVHTLYPLAELNEKNLADFYIGAEIDMESGEIRFIPVKYGDVLKIENIGGYLNMNYPYIMDCGEVLSINFPYSSEIYLYERETGKLKCYNPESVLTTNLIPHFPSKSGYDTVPDEFYSARFLSVHYNKRWNVFFRIYIGEYNRKEKKRDPGLLMVMDRKMKVLSEIRLPDYFTDDFFICEDTLYFFLRNNTDDMYLGAVKIADYI